MEYKLGILHKTYPKKKVYNLKLNTVGRFKRDKEAWILSKTDDLGRIFQGLFSCFELSTGVEDLIDNSLRLMVQELDYDYGLIIPSDKLTKKIAQFSQIMMEQEVVKKLRESNELREDLLLLGEALDRVKAFDELETVFTPRRVESLRQRLFHGKTVKCTLAPLKALDEYLGLLLLVKEGQGVELPEPILLHLDIFTRQLGRELVFRKIEAERILSFKKEDAILAAWKLMTSELDLEKVMANVVDISSRLVGVSRVAVFLIDKQGEYLELINTTHPEDEAVLALTKINLRDVKSKVGKALLHEGKASYLIDAKNNHRGPVELNRAFNVCSILVVPIISPHGGTIGAIFMDEPGEKHLFTDEDLRVMEKVASFAAIAIENAKLYRESETQRERLSELMLRLAQAHEEERARISRELHDSVGSSLLDIIYRAELITEMAAGKEIKDGLRAILQAARSTIAELRVIISDIRPSSLESMGLVRAIQALLDRCSISYGVEIERDIDEELELDELRERFIFRVVQEAFSNIHRHSMATRARLVLKKDDHAVLLVVDDNGKGFDMEEVSAKGGMGLIHMQERAEIMRGSFQVESGRGKGTRITMKIPLFRDDGK